METEESDISKTVETPYGKATVREIRPDGMVILQPNGMYELLLRVIISKFVSSFLLFCLIYRLFRLEARK